MRDIARMRGGVEVVVFHSDGTPENNIIRIETLRGRNTILRGGRAAIARALANDISDSFDFYINRMVWGNHGTAGGVPKYVTDGREGLFGLTVLSKPVIATIDPAVPTQAVFTSVIAFNEANSLTLNEHALQMASGDLYSMRTFPDFNKTQTMQLVINWQISLL